MGKNSIIADIGAALARAATPITKALEAGLDIDRVDDATYATRLAICNGCEHLREDRHCGKCLCPVDYKAVLMYNPYQAATKGKTEEAKTKCPAGLW